MLNIKTCNGPRRADEGCNSVNPGAASVVRSGQGWRDPDVLSTVKRSKTYRTIVTVEYVRFVVMSNTDASTCRPFRSNMIRQKIRYLAEECQPVESGETLIEGKRH